MQRLNLSGSPHEIVRSLTTNATVSSAKGAAVSSTPDQQPAEVMDRLNLRMTDIFGSKWTTQYPRAALDTWSKGLADMTLEQIGRGVTACVTGALEWPPSLPEFRRLCLTIPGLPGVPDPEDAWLEAYAIAAKRKAPHDCSHPVVWHAICECGDLAHMDEAAGEKRFRRIYAVAVRMYAEGKPLTKIPEALPAPQDIKPAYTPEQVAAARDRALAAIDAMRGQRAQGAA